MHDVGLYEKTIPVLHLTMGHKRSQNVDMKCLNKIDIAEILRMVKLIACTNLSTTSRIVGYMCPARRCDNNDLINVYITFFLFSINI